MADDDSVQPTPHASGNDAGGFGVSSPSDAAIATGVSRPDNEKSGDARSPHDENVNRADDDDSPSEPSQFQDIFDFMVGITPERLFSALATQTENVVEAGWMGAANTVKSFIRGDDGVSAKGAPGDLPAKLRHEGGKGHSGLA